MLILTLYSQYIYSLILFVVNNKYLFTTNNEIHEHNTRNNNNNLHPALSNLTKFNKGPCISGIKAFNQLPQHLKALDYNSSNFRNYILFYCILYFIVFYILLYFTIHNISQVSVKSFYSMLLINCLNHCCWDLTLYVFNNLKLKGTPCTLNS